MIPGKLKTFFELIKFEHTMFALPFAYMGMVMADKGWPGFGVFFWVTLAMVSARTAGMTLNRIIDRGIDTKNPRTRNRALVTGEFKVSWAMVITVIGTALLLLSARQLNDLCFKLSPVALIFLTTYHYAKRFTYLCHFILGVVLAIAPLGGWLAVTGSWSLSPFILALAVLVWVAGFDVLYALQDIEFDRGAGLHSIPAQFGESKALAISRICHLVTVACLILFGITSGLGPVYFVGVAVVAGLLLFEHWLLLEGDMTKINAAFFLVNGWIGILLLIFTLMEIYK
jgi:4-hydroxybenzoate polyprenyltransferase